MRRLWLPVLTFRLLCEFLVCGQGVALKAQLQNEATLFEPQLSEPSVSPPGDSRQTGHQASRRQEAEDFLHHPICKPYGQRLPSEEGLTPEGMVLDKVYILLASAQAVDAHKPFGRYPTPSIPCNVTTLTHLFPSEKSKLFRQTVETYLKMRRSKSGLNHFRMMPESTFCREDDVPPFALLQLMDLGERLAKRYIGSALSTLHVSSGAGVKMVRSMSGQKYLQTAVAFLHGLLPEKQFMSVDFHKIENHICRGLGSHCWCKGVLHIDTFMQKAYKDEHEIFKDYESVLYKRRELYEGLSLNDYQPAKELVQSISPWLCELKTIPCDYSRKCLSLNASHINQLLHAIGEHNQYLTNNSLFASYAASDIYTYFQEIFQWLLRSLPGGLKLDVVDDFFLLKVLSVLGVSVHDHVFSGSRLVIEQYRKAKSQGAAKFWKIIYNGEVVTSSIPSCVNDLWRGVCGADTVKTNVENLAEKSPFGVCSFTKDEL